jgi:ubiquitin-conjugating enzyme (huntingtin interacting protein 2)
VWHPNINRKTSGICLDILKYNWMRALALNTTLPYLQAMFLTPKYHDPQDAVVEQQYFTNHEAFVSTAGYWTKTFTNGEDIDIEHKIELHNFKETIPIYLFDLHLKYEV